MPALRPASLSSHFLDTPRADSRLDSHLSGVTTVEAMATIKNILFPVDFSPSCTAMVPMVQRAATLFGAKVTLVYVLEPSASGFELTARPFPNAEEDRKAVACAKLESYLRDELPSPGTPRLVLVGEAAPRIAALAKERGFDVIMMPTHAGIFRRTLLGSTTAKVLNDADCMVMTTQHAETIVTRSLAHREWACAIGLSADSERILRIASQVAESAGANLSLIHVIAAASSSRVLELNLNERLQALEKQAAADSLRDLQRRVGSRAREVMVVGPIRDSLNGAARALQADALFIGRTSPPAAQGRLRDLTYAVVRDAPCPVISV